MKTFNLILILLFSITVYNFSFLSWEPVDVTALFPIQNVQNFIKRANHQSIDIDGKVLSLTISLYSQLSSGKIDKRNVSPVNNNNGMRWRTILINTFDITNLLFVLLSRKINWKTPTFHTHLESIFENCPFFSKFGPKIDSTETLGLMRQKNQNTNKKQWQDQNHF